MNNIDLLRKRHFIQFTNKKLSYRRETRATLYIS